jgi:hypothetical protein
MTSPYDLIIPAGKTGILVNAGSVVLLKDAGTEPVRIFTAWESHIYDSNAAALADIASKGWKYVPAKAAPSIPAAKK